MSIIQTIRDKGAKIAVILIALSLIGFILMDAFTGRSRLFGGNSTTLGKINGKKIDYNDFAKKIEAQEAAYQQQGQHLDEQSKQQLVQNMWDQEVNQTLLTDEFEKLGMEVGKKEMDDILYFNPPDDLRRQLTDEKTGEYKANQLAQNIAETKKRGTDEQKDQLNAYLNSLAYNRMVEKYKNLIAGSIHFAKWQLENENSDASLLAKIAVVNIPYAVIPDSAKEVAVTDEEISDYINKHKDLFQQKVETRTIQYVTFSAAPSSSDSSQTLNQVNSLKQSFAQSADVEAFLNTNGTAVPYEDVYVNKTKLSPVAKDSIAALAKGQVYGPYLDNGNYVLAKLIDTKELPDSVKARHILISTADPRSGTQLLPDSIAEKRIDSIWTAIKNGARFDSLAAKFSTDQSSAVNGGLLKVQLYQGGPESEYFTQGQMVKAFNDSAFFGKKGQIKKVKTEFGYHLIEILDQKNFEPHYKVAYLAKRIDPSDATDQAAENAARSFAANSRDLKSFDANYQKELQPKGIQKLFAPDITENAFSVPGLGVSRQFVKKVFEADKGEVFQFENTIGYNYIVAVVTEINKPGTMSAASARRMVEPILKNKKKAEIIKKAVGPVTSLEAVAAKVMQQYKLTDTLKVQAMDSIRFVSKENTPLSFETRVLGASFNPDNKGKVVPELLEGIAGSIYALRVDNMSSTPVENADINTLRKFQTTQARMSILFSAGQFGGFGQQQYDPAAVLRQAASIKDYRSKFF
ncbi:MAG: peptidylprolyl isomerase [Chitinophagaceae bacterium]